jgi:hypothetical protein
LPPTDVVVIEPPETAAPAVPVPPVVPAEPVTFVSPAVPVAPAEPAESVAPPVEDPPSTVRGFELAHASALTTRPTTRDLPTTSWV